MKKLSWVLPILLLSTISFAKSNSKLKKEEKRVRANYLSFCQKRVQKEKHSLKNAKIICKCSLELILKNGSMEDVATLSKESPKSLKYKTEADKKWSNHLLALSNLEVHSLNGCEKTLQKNN